MKTIIASPKAPKAVGPYSQAVKCGDTLYISGQLPIDGATGAMPERYLARCLRSGPQSATGTDARHRKLYDSGLGIG